MTTVRDVIAAMEAFAPPSLAERWDKIGLQVGREDAVIERALVCLDVDESVVDEAAGQGCGLIIAHHPLFFAKTAALSDISATGRTALKAAERGIAVYVAHTNLDKAAGGINDALAALFELQNTEPLGAGEALFKLVVFVPTEALDAVKRALGDAGAGIIGLYSHCSFSSPGRGSFRPLAGADPTVGEIGTANTVDEYRLEVEVGESDLAAARSAMIAAHPYEEVAHDIYELVNRGRRHGLGRVGDLEPLVPLDDFIEDCRKLFTPALRVAGSCAEVRRVAVCGGSGASLISAAKAAGADVYVTGDIKYHDAMRAVDLGLTIVDAGHENTEKAALHASLGRLRETLPIEVVEMNEDRSIWR